MKKLLIAIATTVALAGPAAACMPPDPADLYMTPNGKITEVVKVDTMTCDGKLCVRPYGSKSACRWIKDPTLEPDYKWIILNGVAQQ
jgi:hypothetical protein